MTPGKTGQFEVRAGSEIIASRGGSWLSRRFGGGYPDFNEIIDLLENHLKLDQPA